ncbi:MAG: hypothetical protein PVF66_14350, partial [Candidatus Aminicenantes bacterium]
FIISGVTLASLVILLIIFVLFIYFNKSFVKNYLEKSVSRRNGIQMTIGRLDYTLFPLHVQADSVKVTQVVGGMEVDVFLSQLNVKGWFGRLVGRKKPFLESIDVADASLRIHIKELEEKPIDYQMIMRQIQDALSNLEQVNVEGFSVQYIMPTSRYDLGRSSFFLSESDKEGEFVFSLNSEKIELDNSPQKFFVAGSIQSSGKFSFLGQPYFEGDVVLTPSKFDFRDESLQLSEVTVGIKGEFPPDKKTVSFPQLTVSIPSIVDVSASLEMDMSEESSLFSSAQIHIKKLSDAYMLFEPYLKPYIPSPIESFAVKGSAYLEGEYRSIRTPGDEKTELKGMMRIEPTQILCVTSAFDFKGSISGEFRTSGSFPDMGLSGSLDIEEGSLSRDDINIQGFSLELSLDGTSSSLEVSRFKGSLLDLSYSSKDRNVDLEKVGFDGQGSIDIAGRKVNLARLDVQIPSLTPVQMNAVVDLQPRGEKTVRLKCSKLDSSAILNLFSSFIPENVMELEPMGLFDLDVLVSQSPETEEQWNVWSTINLSGAGFHNESFTFASESLHQMIVFEGKYNPFKQLMTFSADLDLSKGESLWNAYYVDWSQSPFQLKMSGVYHIPLNKLDDLSMETSLFSEGKINVQGSLSFDEPSLMDLMVSASKLNLGSLYSFLSQGQPIEEYALDFGGDAEAKVRMKMENNSLSLDGQFWIKDGSVKNEDKNLLIDGIQADIPFYYENPVKESAREDSPVKDGYFRVNKFETPALSLAPFQLDIHARTNGFRLEPLTLDMLDGKATLGKTDFTIDPELPSISGILSFSLSDINLSKLPVQSEQFSLNGVVQMDFPRVELTPDEIFTEGKTEVEMFDTIIMVENIHVTKPFTKNRTISCDVKFADLNLEMLTDSIPFGKVTGILKGEVKDLAISYGQPERFILSLESIKKKRVPQKFSLGAVNDLSIISSGEGSAVASNKGFTRFISEFGYAKIGIFCSLKNDMFTLRGTIREKGVEYLVKRSWLFGISVVNKKTRNRIRFKDMMSRLERIGQSEGATTKKKDL